MASNADSFFIPNWPVPDSVGSAISLRYGGVSEGPFSSNNMAFHAGDSPINVQANRASLIEQLNLTSSPVWLDQVHGIDVIYAPTVKGTPEADGSYSDQAGVVCAVMTADCLPVLLCNKQGSQVAVVHAGWRGLAAGVVRKAAAKFLSHDGPLMAFLGPAIGACAFEVGAEVQQAFLDNAQSQSHRQAIFGAFRPSDNTGRKDHYLADIYALARGELNSCGVFDIYGGDDCTFSNPEQFYSYRREPVTGRHATLIWLKDA